MQMRRYRIRYGRLHNIFISHLHGDHVFGLYGLLSTMSLAGRQYPLNLYAPEAFGSLFRSHLLDFDVHLNYEINFIPLSSKDPVKIFEDKNIIAYSFPLQHRVPAFGFLFREKEKERNIRKDVVKTYDIPVAQIHRIKKGSDYYTADGKLISNKKLTIDPPEPRSFAYCSDTRYFSRLADFVRGVNLLYHEATFAGDKSKLATRTGHSTAEQAATVALEAGAHKLIIGHFSARYKNPDILLEEARSVFPDTIAADEGRVIQI